MKDLIIRVITRSSKTEIVEQKDNYLKIKLKSAPVKGEANKELVEFLAKHFDVSKSQVEILKGLTSKDKLIRIYS
ncbi:MAG: DUF167 domain-containing protein [Patescibacteria group bacterium]|jgi:hypothetical protein